jgi:hypothetical protein
MTAQRQTAQWHESYRRRLLVPTFRSSRIFAAGIFRELRKLMGTSKLMILVPLFGSRSLIQIPVLQRRDFKPAALAVLFGFLAGICVACAGSDARATTTERVVANRFSGLAIDGFDPVAYFVDRHPVLGLPDFEAAEAGAIWRFHNEGNRAFFVAHPEIYGPQFGGYDPTEVAIAEKRLYLFGLEANRDAFAADPQRYLQQAQARWPQLEQGLAQ